MGVGGLSIKTFLETNRRNGQKFVSFFIFYIIAVAVAATSSVLMTAITGEMSEAAVAFDADAIIRFLGFMTVLMGIRAVVSALAAFLLGRYSAGTEYRFRDNFARYFLNIPFSKFEKQNGGEMLSVYSNDVPAAASFVTSGSLQMVAEIISVLASFIYMLTINPVYTLIFYAMFPVLVLVQAVISTPIQKKAIIMSEEQANFTAIVNDSLQNTATVAAYSLEEVMEERYLKAYDKFMSAMLDYIKTLLLLVVSGMGATMAPLVFISIVSAVSVINQDMSLAEFIVLIGLAGTAAGWLQMLSQMLGNIRVTLAGAVRMNNNTAEESEDLHKGEGLGSNPVAIAFNDVTFSYVDSDETLALNGVSFEIKNGERVAFVGGSGSGKSTVLKLLLGLYEARSGSISVMGKNIGKVSKNSLRKAFAYVPQDNFMFPESIRENIVNVKDEPPSEVWLEKACSDAGILDFINSLPDKFNSVLTEAAENVSGGQRQRLSLARAFYKDAPMVLFDEATSALDPATEESILGTMRELMKGRTVIMVAHRAKAIASCSKIIVMDGGKVAGIGTHAELMRENAAYKSLYESLEEGGSANE